MAKYTIDLYTLLKDDNFKYQCHEHYRDWDNNWTKEYKNLMVSKNILLNRT